MDNKFLKKTSYPIKFRKWIVTKEIIPSNNLKGLVFYIENAKEYKSLNFDDHFRFYFCKNKDEEEYLLNQNGKENFSISKVESVSRVYTIYKYDEKKQEVIVYFYMHDHGIASNWAKNTKIGDSILSIGPRSSLFINEDKYSNFIMIGDETSIPAIFRRIREYNLKQSLDVYIEIGDSDDKKAFSFNKKNINIHYIMRNKDSNSIINLVNNLDVPNNTHIWIAMETNLTKNLRKILIEKHQYHKQNLYTIGYWNKKECEDIGMIE